MYIFVLNLNIILNRDNIIFWEMSMQITNHFRYRKLGHCWTSNSHQNVIRRKHWCEWLYYTENGKSGWRNLFAWRLFSKHCCELDACNVMWEYLLSISSYLFTFRQHIDIILNRYLATKYRKTISKYEI